jgi:hypothetical protein
MILNINGLELSGEYRGSCADPWERTLQDQFECGISCLAFLFPVIL